MPATYRNARLGTQRFDTYENVRYPMPCFGRRVPSFGLASYAESDGVSDEVEDWCAVDVYESRPCVIKQAFAHG